MIYRKRITSNPSLELDFVIAPPQMAKYMQISTQIYIFTKSKKCTEKTVLFYYI